MKFQFANRATSQLTRALASDDTSLQIVLSEAGRFPQPTVDQPFQLTITSPTGTIEIVRATGRVGNEITVLRGQESTPAGTFPINSRVELSLTAETLRQFLPRGGGTMEGDLDMGGNRIVNVRLATDQGVDTFRVSNLLPADGNPIRGIVLPDNGGYPQVGGFSMLTAEYMHGLIFAYYGDPALLPSFLKLCDGTNNTPDLRERFILGAHPTPGHTPWGSTGGEWIKSTAPGGAHNHGGATGQTDLSAGNTPSHTQTKTYVLINAPNGAGTRVVRELEDPQHAPGVWGHNHSIAVDGTHGHNFDTTPPYMALVYVMFRYTFAGAT